VTKQAPLPWTLTQNSWQYTTIYDADGNSICRLDLEDWSVTEENQDDLEKVQTQIASRIVKAVNSHDMLVNALEFIRDGYDNQDVNHVDFRVKAYRVALDALKSVAVGRQDS
jgi:hypothetical protein